MPWLSGHAAYNALGVADESRRAAYRDLFRAGLESAMVDDIRQATHGNYALGSSCFKAELEQALGRRVSKGQSGRKRVARS